MICSFLSDSNTDEPVPLPKLKEVRGQVLNRRKKKLNVFACLARESHVPQLCVQNKLRVKYIGKRKKSIPSKATFWIQFSGCLTR